ncbi:HlyD family efflux transporter periplasmic adaptor subunit [Bosea sp. TAF32]|uniref:HlyD family efflux transporter periplasmic adaptor subunit n=1 Tax=Bosea sp. TAF32 TaxID=3237482 RepID=UPI003F8E994B
MPHSTKAGLDPKGRAHSRFIKVSAYFVATVLAGLLLTATLPPLVADQSDRAILNAPVTLLTSPIAGEVAAMNVAPGARMAEDAAVAEIWNKRVDRSTLISLQGKAEEFQRALITARARKEADRGYIETLEREISAQKAQLITQLTDQNAGLAGLLSAARAGVIEKGALRDRQQSLVAQNTASPYMLKPTTQQLSAAQGSLDAAAAKLAAGQSQLEAVRNDIFVGDNLVGLATLAQKRRDIAFHLQNQTIEEAQAEAGLEVQLAAVDAEKARLDSLTEARLTATKGGEILSIEAAVGRHVNAGDSLATMVDCRDLFAVAIFSYRQATALSVGTRVLVSGEDRNGPREGIVQDIVPKSNDRSDAQYALPFPQTERREMYVLVKFADEADRPAGACPVGKWVTVTRADGWVPSASVVWHQASTVMGRAVSALWSADAAGAHEPAKRSMR